jgi:hypothetical protein
MAGLIIRHYFSGRYRSGAQYFARRAADIEAGGSDALQGEDFIAHHSSVTGALMHAVAFLEALVNEVLTDAAEGKTTAVRGLTPTQVAEVRKLVALPQTNRLSVLEKYDALHVILIGTPLDKSKDPYQSVQLLVKLRNALVHFFPESLPSESTRGESDEIHRLEKSLRHRFADNQRTGPGNPWYPDKCLGAACAQWAIDSARVFTDTMSRTLGIQTS